MSAERRGALSAHYTPEDLARRLVGMAFDRYDMVGAERPPRVCDPSCGAGSVLLAAADELVARGVSPSEVLRERLLGCDIDPAAVGAARWAMQQWARDVGEPSPPEPRIIEGDALNLPKGFPEVDLVVGNPPFASPLSSAVSRRPHTNQGGGAYADEAVVHLGAAVNMVSPGGVVCLLQPQSVLGSRDAAGIRDEIERSARLEMLWASDADLFSEASVRVCAPVLVRHRGTEPESGSHHLRQSGDRTDEPADGATATVQWNDDPVFEVECAPGEPWASLLAAGMGIPAVRGHPDPFGRTSLVVVGDLARCTAGFRDEFYALAEAACESELAPERSLRAVTVGMIDPAVLRWSDGSFRLAGNRFTAPRVDVARLADVSPRVARWARDRSVPKVLVASQTKVLEAVVDVEGDCVGVTPVVSVEPTGECPPAALAAMLSAPSNSARLATAAAGTGRNPSVLRVGARAVSGLIADRDPAVWQAAEHLWDRFESCSTSRAVPARWHELGMDLDTLIGGGHDEEVVSWWVDRLPRRIVGQS